MMAGIISEIERARREVPHACRFCPRVPRTPAVARVHNSVGWSGDVCAEHLIECQAEWSSCEIVERYA